MKPASNAYGWNVESLKQGEANKFNTKLDESENNSRCLA